VQEGFLQKEISNTQLVAEYYRLAKEAGLAAGPLELNLPTLELMLARFRYEMGLTQSLIRSPGLKDDYLWVENTTPLSPAAKEDMAAHAWVEIDAREFLQEAPEAVFQSAQTLKASLREFLQDNGEIPSERLPVLACRFAALAWSRVPGACEEDFAPGVLHRPGP